MSKVNSDEIDENQNVNYIYCLDYEDKNAVHTNFKPLEVTDTTISCNLEQRQRSSQQILDLADYLWVHYSRSPIRRWNSGKSFSSDKPLWVKLSNQVVNDRTRCFFDYIKDKFDSDDIMLIWDDEHKPSNLNDIKKFCTEQKWRCTSYFNITGSEASVIILYGLDSFHYEFLTRAKTQLVIVTLAGKYRYFH